MRETNLQAAFSRQQTVSHRSLVTLLISIPSIQLDFLLYYLVSVSVLILECSFLSIVSEFEGNICFLLVFGYHLSLSLFLSPPLSMCLLKYAI